MTRTFLLFTVFCWVLNSPIAFSQVEFSHIKNLGKVIEGKSKLPSFQVFVVSTEMIIGKARPILERAPKGLYVTVGSERGFRGASMAPNTTHLLLLDISPTIVRFNHINTELLKAPTLAQYRALRWNANFEEWTNFKKAMKKNHSMKVELAADDYEWWNKNLRGFESFPYPIPELLNRFGKDTVFDRFNPIYLKLNELLKALEKDHSKISKDQLFYSSSYEEWIALKEKSQTNIQLDINEWDWWKNNVGNKENPKYAFAWTQDYSTAIDMGSVIDFKAGNYLYDKALYARLHDLAVQDRIASVLLDLSDESQIHELLSSIKKSHLEIGLLDLDNAFEDSYLGQAVYHKLVNHLIDAGGPNSILLVMRNHKSFGGSQFQIYLGFSFSNVRKWPQQFLMKDFFDTLPKDLPDLIDGRFYDQSEMPPLRYLNRKE